LEELRLGGINPGGARPPVGLAAVGLAAVGLAAVGLAAALTPVGSARSSVWTALTSVGLGA